MRTEGGHSGRVLQDLHYTFDPAGNITHIRDDAHQEVFFANARVEASTRYRYDALFRLTEATGREHLGQAGAHPHSHNDAPRIGRVGIPHASDGEALGRYLERYLYDAVGNIASVQHIGTNPHNPGWTRNYTYAEPSQLEPDKVSNRLTSTTVGRNAAPAVHRYDEHGNMLDMPHLAGMRWNELDQLQMTQRQAVNDTDGTGRHGEVTWYVYDGGGQRIRKVTERPDGRIKDERLYLGAFEIYREHRSQGEDLVRETLHVTDDAQRIALVETRISGDEKEIPRRQVRYQLANHLGSASLEVDDQARILSYEEYSPYGSTTYQAVRSQLQTPKRYRFTAMERDDESGLNYHSARYYAPWLGRWVSADPVGYVDGPNLYAYAANNPILSVDPTGTKCDPKVQSCPEIDPTASTPREEALQQSLPEDERYLPPNSEPGSVSEATHAQLRLNPNGPTFEDFSRGVEERYSEKSLREFWDETDEPLGEEYYEEEYTEYVTETYEETQESALRSGAVYVIAGIGTDVSVPEPTDVAPWKWVGYGLAAAAAALVLATTSSTTITRTRVVPRTTTRKVRQPYVYVTYTRFNPATGETYAGRAGGYGTPAHVLGLARLQPRHVLLSLEGFDQMNLDRSLVATRPPGPRRYGDPSYLAIRGREQQLIDKSGGAWSHGRGRGGPHILNPRMRSTSRNVIRGVRPLNPRGITYHNAATRAFGPLAPYTGNNP